MDIVNKTEAPDTALPRLGLALFFIEWVRGAFLVAFLPIYALDHLGLSAAAVGIAVSIHYLTDSLIKGFIGYLLDRLSHRTVLHSGFGVALAGLLLMVTTNYAGLLIAASALLGAGLSPIWIICMSHVREENRARQMGSLYVYWMAGLGLGTVINNVIMDWGLAVSLLAIGLFFAAGWISAGLARLSEAPVPQAQITVGEQFAALWHKVKKGGFLMPGMLLQTAAGGMIVPLLTTFAVNRLGLSHSGLSLALLIGGGAAVLLMVPMGKLFDMIGGKWFLVLGFAVFAVSLYLLTSAGSFISVVVLALLMGCAYATLLPSWNALMALYIPESSVGMSWGLLFSVEGLGAVIGPFIGGWLASGGNEVIPFKVSACIFGVISLIYLLSPSEKFANPERQAKLQQQQTN
ncbi:MFS transporter [Paenibacillus zanthoxyli]|uniref:MFS transporter n=1 Tax=Paenibacillus zanthoxyli TaxID=369399 RepID=UPI000472903B|nr:MFS transporter [Paenibacillus zanthoxyli]